MIDWKPVGVPITALMIREENSQLIVPKSMVNLQGPAFAALMAMRKTCAVADKYKNPGPLQFSGPTVLTDSITKTLTLESFEHMRDIEKIQCTDPASLTDGITKTLTSASFEHMHNIKKIKNALESVKGVSRYSMSVLSFSFIM